MHSLDLLLSLCWYVSNSSLPGKDKLHPHSFETNHLAIRLALRPVLLCIRIIHLYITLTCMSELDELISPERAPCLHSVRSPVSGAVLIAMRLRVLRG